MPYEGVGLLFLTQRLQIRVLLTHFFALPICNQAYPGRRRWGYEMLARVWAQLQGFDTPAGHLPTTKHTQVRLLLSYDFVCSEGRKPCLPSSLSSSIAVGMAQPSHHSQNSCRFTGSTILSSWSKMPA